MRSIVVKITTQKKIVIGDIHQALLDSPLMLSWDDVTVEKYKPRKRVCRFEMWKYWSPQNNSYRYCPYCGGELKARTHEQKG